MANSLAAGRQLARSALDERHSTDGASCCVAGRLGVMVPAKTRRFGRGSLCLVRGPGVGFCKSRTSGGVLGCSGVRYPARIITSYIANNIPACHRNESSRVLGRWFSLFRRDCFWFFVERGLCWRCFGAVTQSGKTTTNPTLRAGCGGKNQKKIKNRSSRPPVKLSLYKSQALRTNACCRFRQSAAGLHDRGWDWWLFLL